jgi:2-polyprenyl-3-methyl-5-hydroxy-6-metoxy-1,4-benzoquinol methylase
MNENLFGEEYFTRGPVNNYQVNENHPYYKALVRLILEYKKAGELLEIGCAYGYFLKYAEKYFKTCGMDISDWAIDRAREVTRKTKLITGDIRTDLAPLSEDNRFDVIVALDVLEHVESPENILKALHHLLSDEGYLFFRVPNLSSIMFRFYSLKNQKEKWQGYRDKTHVSLLSVKEWERICKDVGFECKLIAHTPTRFIKKQVCRISPRRIFLPSVFMFINESILFLCEKKI